jgi:hypothetical protein
MAVSAHQITERLSLDLAFIVKSRPEAAKQTFLLSSSGLNQITLI